VTLLIKGTFSILSNVISTILLANSFYSIWKVRSIFGELANNTCGDTQSNTMFGAYNVEIVTTLVLDIVVFAWIIFSVSANNKNNENTKHKLG